MKRTLLALSLVVIAAGCSGIVEEQLATGDEAVKSQAIYSDNLHAPWSDHAVAGGRAI